LIELSRIFVELREPLNGVNGLLINLERVSLARCVMGELNNYEGLRVALFESQLEKKLRKRVNMSLGDKLSYLH